MLKGDILCKRGKQNTLLRKDIMPKSAFLLLKLCFFSQKGMFFSRIFFCSNPLGGLKLGDPCNRVWNYCHVFVCMENFQSRMISIGFIQFQPVSVQHHFLESKLKILNFQNSKLVFIYHTPNSAGRLSKYCCKYAYGSFCQSKP